MIARCGGIECGIGGRMYRAERNRTLLTDRIDDLRNAVQKVLTARIDAMEVPPDHLHADMDSAGGRW